ncbi:MAG: ECF-type sigma factor [Lysobacteraceae bacterium]
MAFLPPPAPDMADEDPGSAAADSETSDALVAAWRQGEPGAADRLFHRLYPELRQLAIRALAPHRRGPTLDTSALVQEACLRLLGNIDVQSLPHLKALAAAAMRQIVVDHARRHLATKRGGDWVQITLGPTVEHQPGESPGPMAIVEIDQALQKLAALGERPVRVVECRFFAGMSEIETAEALSLSRSTVQREWRKAQSWLQVLRSAANEQH